MYACWLEGLKVGYIFVHKLEELLKERMWGPWNTLTTITLLSGYLLL